MFDHIGEDAEVEGLLRESLLANGTDLDDARPELAIGNARSVLGEFPTMDQVSPVACFQQHVAAPASDLEQRQPVCGSPAPVQVCGDLIQLERGSGPLDDVELGGEAVILGCPDEVVAAVDRSQFIIARLRVLNEQAATIACLDRDALNLGTWREALGATHRAASETRARRLRVAKSLI